MTTRHQQERVPFGLGQGDRVIFHTSDDDETVRHGLVVAILSTQFLLEDEERNMYVTHFRHVKPFKGE